MNDAFGAFHKAVYDQDTDEGESHGWIQWKGTEVCIDTHCKCGHHGHYDGLFFYFYQCPACGAKYAVGQVVKMIELTDQQVTFVEQQLNGFASDEIETPANPEDC